MIEARYYYKQENGYVVCELCPHMCELAVGKTGICKVRTNINGKLFNTNYGLLTAVNMDPVEKKPLFHYYPGKKILSIGSNGCNLKCKCCQNWEIAQTTTKNYLNFKKIEHNELIEIAQNRTDNIGVAYTYNEPVIWIEYMLDIAENIKKAGLKNVLVSNGYVNRIPLQNLLEVIDAFNIDIKAFTNDKYREIANSDLEPVKKTIKTIVDAGKHVELTNLIIPGINDNTEDFKKMINWIHNELGEETVLHLSRYFPAYKMKTEPTPILILKELFGIASEKLKYVYLGNVNIESSQDTFCSKCSNKLIERRGYFTRILAINEEGKCEFCSNQILKN